MTLGGHNIVDTGRRAMCWALVNLLINIGMEHHCITDDAMTARDHTNGINKDFQVIAMKKLYNNS